MWVHFSIEDPGLSFVFGIANAEVDPSRLESEANEEFEKIQMSSFLKRICKVKKQKTTFKILDSDRMLKI